MCSNVSHGIPSICQFFASQDALEVLESLTVWVSISLDFTDVTRVSEDTFTDVILMTLMSMMALVIMMTMVTTMTLLSNAQILAQDFAHKTRCGKKQILQQNCICFC